MKFNKKTFPISLKFMVNLLNLKKFMTRKFILKMALFVIMLLCLTHADSNVKFDYQFCALNNRKNLVKWKLCGLRDCL
jgi:hypothetical protein